MASPDAAILQEIARISGKTDLHCLHRLTISHLSLFALLQAPSTGQRQLLLMPIPTRRAIQREQPQVAVITAQEDAIHIINHLITLIEVVPLIPLTEGEAILLSHTLRMATTEELHPHHHHPPIPAIGVVEEAIIRSIPLQDHIIHGLPLLRRHQRAEMDQLHLQTQAAADTRLW